MSDLDLPTAPSAFGAATGDMLAAILDQSADCIKVIGADGTIEYMNRNGQCAMEIDDFCMVSGQAWASLWPDDARGDIEGAMAAARGGGVARFEAFCPTAKGTPRWWDVSVSPLRRGSNTIEGFIATSRDITEQVNAAALREAVTDEMRHRLRNSYVVVGSLLSAYARGKPEQSDFVADMVDRLRMLGIAQTMKADGADARLLDELVPALLLPYATPDCPIEIGALPPAALDQGRVDALAMVLGELAVNSTKHGALGTRGRVAVTAERGEETLMLRWSERSDRRVADHAREGGQGMTLMSRILASRGGTLEIEWLDDGLDATIILRV